MPRRTTPSKGRPRRGKAGREFRHRVGERIRVRREAAGLSQTQLARKLPGEMDGSQISRWERGENFPTYANLVALARALGVTEEELLAADADPPAAAAVQAR